MGESPCGKMARSAKSFVDEEALMVAPLQSPLHQAGYCCSLNLGTVEVQNQLCFQCPQEHTPRQLTELQ